MFKLQNEEMLKNRDTSKPVYITVAGNVGAGKSTLTRMLGERLGFETHFEKVDGNPYLEDFYRDKLQYGFRLQLYFLSQRFNQQQEICSNGKNNIQDRSIYEDCEIFAKELNKSGDMSDIDYQTYYDLFYNLSKHLDKPDLMIFLDGSIDKVLERIGIRGRDMEKAVDKEYWTSLHNRYREWIPNYKESTVLHVNIDEFDLIKNPEHLDLICEKIKNILNI